MVGQKLRLENRSFSPIKQQPGEEDLMPKRTLSVEEVARLGMKTNHEQMDNGELRFRLMGEDGSGYIRTVSGSEGAWQNSHYHMSVREFIAVQHGWIAFADWSGRDGSVHLRILRAGETVVSEPGMAHNVYTPVGSVTHCVKFGVITADDWHASPDLDKYTKYLDEDQIMVFDKKRK